MITLLSVWPIFFFFRFICGSCLVEEKYATSSSHNFLLAHFLYFEKKNKRLIRSPCCLCVFMDIVCHCDSHFVGSDRVIN
jgi:hypothetical protein